MTQQRFLPVDHYLERELNKGLREMGMRTSDARMLSKQAAETFRKMAEDGDEEMEKLASVPAGNALQMGSNIARHFMDAVGKTGGTALTALGVGAALYGANKLMHATVTDPRNRAKFDQAVAQAIMKNQVLQHADKAKVSAVAETVYKYAPNAAADANLLSSVLATAIDYGGLDTQTIQSLINLENGYQRNNTTDLKALVVK